jgi:hypothetical protein
MKKITSLLILLAITIATKAQTISLGIDNEYCPNVEYEFTITLPGAYVSISTTQMLITQQPYSFNQSNTSFKFKAKFNDVNIKQSVAIRYSLNNQTVTFTSEYKKVKSLFNTNLNSCGLIQPKFTANNLPVTSFNAPLCQVTTFSITFTAAKWFTQFETPVYCFGSIADYEYLLPANWKLGTNTSNGTTWLQGTNSVTITSDFTTGNGATIQIRPKNTCGTNLSNSQIPVQIPVSRSASSLTMSASPNSIPCGSTTPVTFTINASSLTGITGYTWNIGSPNGWLYNGSPAPSSINTTTNTITLTSVCGAALASPTGAVTVSNAGSNCTIDIPATSLSITPPALSIQGTQSLCSGNSSYSINGLVCNSSVSWTPPPSSLATLNSLTTSPTTLTSTGTSGNFTLTANVTSCGVTTPVTLAVRTGGYTSSDYTLSGGSGSTQPLYWCPGKSYSFSINGPGSNYLWTPPTGWSLGYGSGYFQTMNAPTSTYPPSGSASVTFTEPCGTTITKTFFVAYSSTACTGTDPRFTYAPNPAPSYLNVAVASGYSNVYIKRIQIQSVSTGFTVFDQSYGSFVTSTYITTSSFTTGTYSLRIYDGSVWANYQFMK